MPAQIVQDKDREDYFKIYHQVNIPTDYKKTKPEISVLWQSMDRPVAVLGGGPSLPDDLKLIPNNSFLISCNHHAFRLVNPDMMVFLDSPKTQGAPQEWKDRIELKERDYSVISFRELDYTDYYCVNQKPWAPGESGCFGLWVACYITSLPVYLCGMNLRLVGENNHFYDDEIRTHWGGDTLDNKLIKWAVAHKVCHRPERIKVVSGPLKEVFK